MLNCNQIDTVLESKGPMSQTTNVSIINNPAIEVSQPCVLETRLQAALEHARRLSAMNESSQLDIAIAWETVEELTAAQRRQQASRPSAFERYCAENPDAPEARIYDC
ncbi:Calvin cycle protein CP12 [Sphaerothrix gracilis]|uniref:Calvin cycle protein CP12 n=1 Tax=Sphaerothrix gracilis TaxID=3151835 RepID=UPI0031FE2710